MLDVATTPAADCVTLSKGMWLVIVGVFWVFGAVAWLVGGRPRRGGLQHPRQRRRRDVLGPAQAMLRHPAAQPAGGYGDLPGWPGQAAEPGPAGPDDDDDFLAELARRIRDARGGLSAIRPMAANVVSHRGARYPVA